MERKTIYLEDGWAFIVKYIKKLIGILEGSEEQFTSEEYMNLYTTIYNMSTQKPPYDYSEQLYDRYCQAFGDYINSTVLPSLKEKHGEFMLRELVWRWDNHKVMVRWLSRFFHYLDRYYITRRQGKDSLKDAGLKQFKELAYMEMHAAAKDAVMGLINREREGEKIDKGMMTKVVDLFVEIGMGEMENYEKDFEIYMVDDSGEYYSRKASVWIVEDSCPEYMVKAEEALRKELERVEHYLHSSSEQKLVERVQKELLVVHGTQLLEKEESGCQALLRDDRMDDLSRMYRLYHKIPQGLEPIAAMFKKHVTNKGTALIQKAEDNATKAAASSKKQGGGAAEPGIEFVGNVLEQHDKDMGYVLDCFQNHSLLHKALKEAFEVFCNKTMAGYSSAELLATFCDNTLRKISSEKKSSEDATEKTLEKVVMVLAYISDKDLFAEFCRKRLGRRLLIEKTGGDDDHENERFLLTKLKQQYGGQFTNKMEGMVTDITVSKESVKSFKDFLQKEDGTSKLGLDFNVTVLTTGNWPTYKTSDLHLPEEMVKCVEVFKEYYDRLKKHRKLSWIYSMGNCAIKGNFDTKSIELIVSTYQAALLLLFNSSEKLSFSEIVTQSNLTKDEVVRTLHSLSCSKYKILSKEPDTKTISPNDTFEFNSKFTDKMRRVKVPPVPPPQDERKKVTEDVDKERKYTIDAALVRIMKMRKVLGHQQLVTECIEQLQKMFKPDIKTIKRRIEDLITRDYLERDPENPNTFKYLA